LKFQEQRMAVLDSYLDAREGLSEEEKQKRLVRKAKWVGEQAKSFIYNKGDLIKKNARN
jgi:hypothetical protein